MRPTPSSILWTGARLGPQEKCKTALTRLPWRSQPFRALNWTSVCRAVPLANEGRHFSTNSYDILKALLEIIEAAEKLPQPAGFSAQKFPSHLARMVKKPRVSGSSFETQSLFESVWSIWSKLENLFSALGLSKDVESWLQPSWGTYHLSMHFAHVLHVQNFASHFNCKVQEFLNRIESHVHQSKRDADSKPSTRTPTAYSYAPWKNVRRSYWAGSTKREADSMTELREQRS